MLEAARLKCCRICVLHIHFLRLFLMSSIVTTDLVLSLQAMRLDKRSRLVSTDTGLHSGGNLQGLTLENNDLGPGVHSFPLS